MSCDLPLRDGAMDSEEVTLVNAIFVPNSFRILNSQQVENHPFWAKGSPAI
jgi:hypothetical protein